MAPDVDAALEKGADKGSNWSVAGLTILGLALNVAIILGLAIDQPFYDGEMVEVNGNELYYDASIPQKDIDKLLLKLESNDFFGSDYGNIARLQQTGEGYLITMLIDEQLWTDSGIIGSLTSMKWVLEVEFGKKNQTSIRVCSTWWNF